MSRFTPRSPSAWIPPWPQAGLVSRRLPVQREHDLLVVSGGAAPAGSRSHSTSGRLAPGALLDLELLNLPQAVVGLTTTRGDRAKHRVAAGLERALHIR